MNKIETKNKELILTDKDFRYFIQNEDVLDMTEENMNYIFDSLYGCIMKDAVYPHLTVLKKT